MEIRLEAKRSTPDEDLAGLAQRQGVAGPTTFWGWLQSQAYASETLCRDDLVDMCRRYVPSRPRVLLDCGCGPGDFTASTAQAIGARYVVGIDVVAANIATVNSKGLHGIVGDLDRSLPVACDNVDLILASHVIEHLCDTDTFVTECYRVLKPGGHLVMATPNLAGFTNVLLLLLGKQPSIAEVSDVALVGTWSPRGGHVRRRGPAHRRIFTTGALKGLLEYHGFQCERIRGSGFLPMSGWPAKIAAALLGRYASNMVAVAVKPTSRSGISGS